VKALPVPLWPEGQEASGERTGIIIDGKGTVIVRTSFL
jgi:hypothetical protein